MQLSGAKHFTSASDLGYETNDSIAAADTTKATIPAAAPPSFAAFKEVMVMGAKNAEEAAEYLVFRRLVERAELNAQAELDARKGPTHS